MKKMLFSAVAFAVVAVSAVAVAPTTSEAIPAFARQTGAACLSCHFMSFPTLSAFGRSFKQGGFTDMGEQGLVEDDGLSIPVVVNMTAVLRPQFVNTSANSVNTSTAAITADQVILFGGRFGTNSGVFIEYDGTYANYQNINSFDMGGMKVGASIFNTGFGETAGMEVGSTFGQHGGLMAGKNISASEQISKNVGNVVPGGNGNIGGVAFFAANDLVTASLSLITSGAALDGTVGNGWKLAPSLRVFANPEIGGMEVGIGAGYTTGNTGNSQTAVALGLPGATKLAMKKYMVDAQVQGEAGDLQFGVYFDYSSAAASSGNEINIFNGDTGALSGYSLRANVKPLHNVIVGAGLGSLKDSANKTDQMQVSAEYEIYQNFVIALIYNSSKATPTGGSAVTTNTTTLDIEALL